MIVVLIAKFVEGAWITLMFIPLTLLLFRAVRRHYHNVAVATHSTVPLQLWSKDVEPIVVVPIDRWSAISKQGLELAAHLSHELIAVHVEPG